jgi:hypothetical protein
MPEFTLDEVYGETEWYDLNRDELVTALLQCLAAEAYED